MTILLIILVGVIIIGLGGTGAAMIGARKNYGMGILASGQLSWPAREIMKAHHALPKGNRPSDDMFEVLKAIDTRWGGSERVTKAYTYNRGQTYRQGWDECHNGGMNKQYKNLFDSMKDIQRALDEQAQALVLSGLTHHLDTAAELVERMRDEAKNIREVTTELTRDPLELK